MSRLEPVLVAFFLATWVVDLLGALGVVDLRGSLELGLYPLYSTAATAGWLAGNVYVARGRGLPGPLRRRILLVYFLGPPGLFFLLRSMASADTQRAAPLVPLYSLGVFGVLFMVPLLFPRSLLRHSSGRGERDGDRDRDRDGGRGGGQDGDPPVVP